MKSFIYSFSFFVAILSCHRKTTNQNFAAEQAIPLCIQQRIDSIKQHPAGNPAAEINEYSYKNQTVYLISAPCCDQYSIAVDSVCNYVCAPSGGFTGRGDGKCVDFLEKAKFVQLVWKDERAKK